ncbi:MAG: nucleotidyl transferase AbiEii/AbiGii toxin family protein [Dehalococcoidales bacterium]|nr:nucleotidyl transferase AbiEii/AbiGii toxin family protein [Dehalococcoidales bacterium]
MAEARLRFVQYAVLRAVASSRALSSILVLKGGNALDFVWRPNRSTLDLDFSVDEAAQPSPLDTESLRSLLQPALEMVGRTLGIAFRVQSVEQHPPGPNRHFVTFEAKIGFALPDQLRGRAQIEQGRPVSSVVTLEISINEPICADEGINIGGLHPLRVCTLDDIVAEKLRALLQQKSRNRTRRQDLLDIAVILRGPAMLDPARVSCFLLRKAAARQVPVSRNAFRDPDLAERARRDYDALRLTTREEFVPFEEARDSLLAFVEGLDIPEVTVPE